MIRRVDRFLKDLEWRWALWQIIQGTGILTAFAIPAWAAYVAKIFEQYAPFSWVAAGLLGVLILTGSYNLYARARGHLQIVKFRGRVLEGSFVNPLDKTFEARRIRVSDLSPPIGGIIRDKTFVECDIIGPANVIFFGCTFNSNSGDAVDGIVIKDNFRPKNGFAFQNCNFTRCRFYLLTFIVPESMYQSFRFYGWEGLNWITDIPTDAPELPFAATTQATSAVGDADED